MRYFHDAEFFEDGKTIELISLALVAEDGREFYACSLDMPFNRVAQDPWMRANVLAQLPNLGDHAWMTREQIRDEVTLFTGGGVGGTLTNGWTAPYRAPPVADPKPEFWCWYGASDWVAFYQLWGKLLDLPDRMPKWFRELKQLAADHGDVKLPAKPKDYEGRHSALIDARWNRDVYNFLTGRKR